MSNGLVRLVLGRGPGAVEVLLDRSSPLSRSMCRIAALLCERGEASGTTATARRSAERRPGPTPGPAPHRSHAPEGDVRP
jgi:hypothetical protein